MSLSDAIGEVQESLERLRRILVNAKGPIAKSLFDAVKDIDGRFSDAVQDYDTAMHGKDGGE